ncbi:hypothetical protein ACSFA3_02090 [Variovorax sp. RHLX14]|uniref:hypothetical protein n=1 Tax=Variovorax sp. RHLX14 TaxID=1259731 RepID=UPI003F47D730
MPNLRFSLTASVNRLRGQFTGEKMRNIDSSLSSRPIGLLPRDGARPKGYSANPAPYAPAGMVPEYRPSWLAPRDWHENSLAVLNMQEFEQRVQLRNRIEQNWQSHQQMNAPWQSPPLHQPHNLQWQQAYQAPEPMLPNPVRQPLKRAEPDVVHYVSNLLRISTADARLSVNFDEHAEGFPMDGRTLNVDLSSSEELSRAYASLANLRQSMTLRNGETVRIESRVPRALMPGGSHAEIDLYVLRDNDLPGCLTVSLRNQNPLARRDPGVFYR